MALPRFPRRSRRVSLRRIAASRKFSLSEVNKNGLPLSSEKNKNLSGTNRNLAENQIKRKALQQNEIKTISQSSNSILLAHIVGNYRIYCGRK